MFYIFIILQSFPYFLKNIAKYREKQEYLAEKYIDA